MFSSTEFHTTVSLYSLAHTSPATSVLNGDCDCIPGSSWTCAAREPFLYQDVTACALTSPYVSLLTSMVNHQVHQDMSQFYGKSGEHASRASCSLIFRVAFNFALHDSFARLACIVLFDGLRGGQSQACRKFSALFSLNFSSSDDDEDEVCSSIK